MLANFRYLYKLNAWLGCLSPFVSEQEAEAQSQFLPDNLEVARILNHSSHVLPGNTIVLTIESMLASDWEIIA
ncbi:hypothetical protein V6N13_138465 [Hibiscus sabdariffa]